MIREKDRLIQSMSEQMNIVREEINHLQSSSTAMNKFFDMIPSLPIVKKAKTNSLFQSDVLEMEPRTLYEKSFQPVILPGDLNDKTIKLKTGFKNEMAMISYILVVNNGDINEMMTNKETQHLTWLEEWYLFFVIVWGRHYSNIDEVMMKNFGIGMKQTVYKIFDAKAHLAHGVSKLTSCTNQCFNMKVYM